MVGILLFDLRTDSCCPFCYDGSVASLTAGFITDLPREDGGRGLVAVDDEVDPVEICGLGIRIREEGSIASTIAANVATDTAKSVPVIQKWYDELDVERFGLRDDEVQLGNTFYQS